MYIKKFREFLFEKDSGKGKVDKELYKRWKSFINMKTDEIKKFMNSEEGKKAGLSKSEAKKEGIHSGRQSASWLLKMIPIGKTYEDAEKNWTPEMWYWAGRQVSFNSRMSKIEGDLIDKNGNKTGKYLSLLIWGHDPKKK